MNGICLDCFDCCHTIGTIGTRCNDDDGTRSASSNSNDVGKGYVGTGFFSNSKGFASSNSSNNDHGQGIQVSRAHAEQRAERQEILKRRREEGRDRDPAELARRIKRQFWYATSPSKDKGKDATRSSKGTGKVVREFSKGKVVEHFSKGTGKVYTRYIDKGSAPRSSDSKGKGKDATRSSKGTGKVYTRYSDSKGSAPRSSDSKGKGEDATRSSKDTGLVGPRPPKGTDKVGTGSSECKGKGRRLQEICLDYVEMCNAYAIKRRSSNSEGGGSNKGKDGTCSTKGEGDVATHVEATLDHWRLLDAQESLETSLEDLVAAANDEVDTRPWRIRHQ